MVTLAQKALASPPAGLFGGLNQPLSLGNTAAVHHTERSLAVSWQQQNKIKQKERKQENAVKISQNCKYYDNK